MHLNLTDTKRFSTWRCPVCSFRVECLSNLMIDTRTNKFIAPNEISTPINWPSIFVQFHFFFLKFSNVYVCRWMFFFFCEHRNRNNKNVYLALLDDEVTTNFSWFYFSITLKWTHKHQRQNCSPQPKLANAFVHLWIRIRADILIWQFQILKFSGWATYWKIRHQKCTGCIAQIWHERWWRRGIGLAPSRYLEQVCLIFSPSGQLSCIYLRANARNLLSHWKCAIFSKYFFHLCSIFKQFFFNDIFVAADFLIFFILEPGICKKKKNVTTNTYCIVQTNTINYYLRIITTKKHQSRHIQSVMRVDIAISYFKLHISRAIHFNRIERFPFWHRWHFEHEWCDRMKFFHKCF